MKNILKIFLFITMSLSLIGSFVVGIFYFDYLKNKDDKINIEKKEHQANPFEVAFYENVYKFKKKEINVIDKKIYAGIIPHHLLAGDLIAEFYNNLKDEHYDTIILIGPNHFKAGNSNIISSLYNWNTPYGKLDCDQDFLKNLQKENSSIQVEEKIFEKEHAINSHVSFIKKTFPDAKFLPLVLHPSVKSLEAEKLAQNIFELSKDKKILVLASVDFSHYKNSETAQKNDLVSINALREKNFQEIYNLDIDSPSSIFTVMKYADLQNSKFELLNNSNSAILAGKEEVESTTSYVTGYFSFKNEDEEKFINFLPKIDSEINMLFFGDLMLDRYIFELIQKKSGTSSEEKGLDFIFEKINKEINFADYDLVGANLEGAVTDNGLHLAPELVNDFAFNPEIVDGLKKYNFTFFNLANNHLADQGKIGIEQTENNLAKSSFKYSGCYDKKVSDDCSYEIIEIENKKFAMMGLSMVYGDFDFSQAEEILKNLASSTDYVFVNIHWGKEYINLQNEKQKEVAHKLIDAGADMIIGHHPHVVQGLEVYQKKLIFYSLGNFIFDQPELYFPKENSEGLAIEINIKNNKPAVYLLPFKFKSWQLELMKDEEISDFLNKLCDFSELSEDFEKQVKSAVIEF